MSENVELIFPKIASKALKLMGLMCGFRVLRSSSSKSLRIFRKSSHLQKKRVIWANIGAEDAADWGKGASVYISYVGTIISSSSPPPPPPSWWSSPSPFHPLQSGMEVKKAGVWMELVRTHIICAWELHHDHPTLSSVVKTGVVWVGPLLAPCYWGCEKEIWEVGHRNEIK